jgi:hypothetical protein
MVLSPTKRKQVEDCVDLATNGIDSGKATALAVALLHNVLEKAKEGNETAIEIISKSIEEAFPVRKTA